MTKGLKREGMPLTLESMKVLGEKYAALFLEDIRALGVDTERITFPRASAYVPAQVAMIRSLEEKGYAYRTDDGVYFDTSRFPDYGKLGNIDLAGLREGARVAVSGQKRHPIDFLLWKSDKNVGWNSPWGTGFPGWHIECSAMIRATLGEQIDIHTGGIEHIPVHHNNEIAQSEAATGRKPFSRFWLHRAHIQIEDSKIAKSEGNVVYLSDVIARGIHPYALRYLFLGAHYRTPSNFSWEALGASFTAFLRLRTLADSLPKGGKPPEAYRTRFHQRVNDDLDISGALAVIWEMLKDKTLPPADVRAGIIDADRVFGLSLDFPDPSAQEACLKRFGVRVDAKDLPSNVRSDIEARVEARADRDWQSADEIRARLEALGYILEDSESETIIYKK